jgi:glycosyltransferase involved in cell wall biosynthesis
MTIFSCTAPYDVGGLGRHFSELIDQARDRGEEVRYFSRNACNKNGIPATQIDDPRLPLLMSTIWRFNNRARNWADCHRFDRMVARMLDQASETFVGFGAQSLESFSKARRLGTTRCIVVAGCSHVDNVRRKHDQAERQHPIERSWMGDAYRAKAKREYESADLIYVASEYTRQTFLAENVPAEKLHRVHFVASPRYKPADVKPKDGIFRVVYTGTVTVAKGVPVLIEAFRRFTGRPAELTLVGGTSTRGMKHYIAESIAADPRIKIAPGDPLPHLQKADVYVHPSYEDGFAYAPMEAIACGVPAIVTEDTGMKEHIREGETGYIVPTGESEPIVELLKKLAMQ